MKFDEEGNPFSIHYERLAPMLLNEMQRQQRVNEEQRAQLAMETKRNSSQQSLIDEQRSMIAALAHRLERVEEQLAAKVKVAGR